MGSFANSAHIRHDDHDVVAAAVNDLLTEAGYVATTDMPGPEEWESLTPKRGIFVSEAGEGWVSLLDSSMMGIDALTAALSERLSTVALVVSVNDSDWWQMTLMKDGELADHFSTMSDEELFAQFGTEFGGELIGMMDAGDEDGAAELLGQRIGLIQQQMTSLIPPEMREIQERIGRGEATDEDRRRFDEWMDAATPDLLDNLMAALGDLAPGLVEDLDEDEEALAPRQPRQQLELGEDELREHVKQLRPLLAPGVTEDELASVLTTCSPYAEDDLESFITLLGISPGWAYLAYSYLFEFDESELAEVGVFIAESLAFKLTEEEEEDEGPQLRLV